MHSASLMHFALLMHSIMRSDDALADALADAHVDALADALYHAQL